MISRIAFETLHNTRDLGGFVNKDGKRIKPNRLIRSARISDLSEKDQLKFKEIGLSEVVDFRNVVETLEHPDTKIEGVTYHFLPILKEEALGVTQGAKERKNYIEDIAEKIQNSDYEVDDFMMNIYQQILTDDFCKHQYKKFLEIVSSHHEGAILWHCSSGKDRCGMGTALVLAALNFDESFIIDEYLMSNEFNKDIIEERAQQAAKLLPIEGLYEAVKEAESVKKSFIECAFNEAKKQYNNLHTYLVEGLGITEQQLMQLQALYLE